METPWTGYAKGQDVPLAGYAALMSIFTAGAAAAFVASRRRWIVPETPADLLMTGLAVHELARIVTRDAVTGAVRAPFTEYVGTAGAGEVRERPRGKGLQRAIGQLLTCPFCATPWAATALLGALAVAPRPARFARALLVVSSISSFTQQLYAACRRMSG
jgi:hypothetical protein